MENPFGISVSKIKVLLKTMGPKPNVVWDIVLIYAFPHNILRTHYGRGVQQPTPQGDLPVLTEQFLGGADENCRMAE